MRPVLLILLSLILSACSNPAPQVQVLHGASPALAGQQRFELQPPERAVDGALPFPERYAQLERLLSSGLEARGYRRSPPAQLRVYYWLALGDTPLEFRVDVPPPNALGPYQAIHRLRDETGTLRLRLTDLQDRTLWEGLASTGLSPARDSEALLARAVAALLQQVPATH
ncbi:MAG TPA: hypothetical protein VJA19_10390 [Pseudomonas sp.]|nr:hypothetical protein [Pseudomonas sp.]